MTDLRALWLLLVPLPVASAAEIGVFVQIGLRDTTPTAWSGTVSVDAGEIRAVEGWLLGAEDRIEGVSYQLTTDPLAPAGNRPRALPNGLLLALDAPETTTVSITANGRTWRLGVAALGWDRPSLGLDGDVSAQRVPLCTTLQDTAREDDYPAAAALSSGDVVAAWQSWSEADGVDRLFVARFSGGAWGPAEPLPGVAGDLYRVAVTDDGAGGYYLAWTEMIGDDYELRACRRGADGTWAPPIRLTNRSGHDTDVALATALDGRVYAVWRGFNGPSADIFRATCEDGRWSVPAVLDDSPGNEWFPAIAAGPGGVWAVWDSYRYGSYDVFAARLDVADPEIVAVAATPRFEAGASVACAPNGDVWVSWQDAPPDWGKDTGATLPRELVKQRLYQERNVGLACRRDGRWLAAPDPAAALPEGQRKFLEEPRVQVDAGGRVWLAYRRLFTVPRQRGQRVFGERVWENYVAVLDAGGWTAPRYVAGRMGRKDTAPALVPCGAGVMLVFHTDGRDQPDLRRMSANRIYATALLADGSPALPEMAPREPATPQPVNVAEAAQVARCRATTVVIDGREHRLLRGDTHRHTEVSWDGTGDGGLIDAYRYAADAAALDFFLVSDHNQRCGVDLAYVNWWCYKVADVMHNPGVFTTLFGYERSLGYPDGHRNILQAKRGHPSFRMGQTAPDLPKLYDYARETEAIVIPHTTGTNHGTDWYAYDRALEPVAEIFQGCRRSYEYEGCPKGGEPGDAAAEEAGYQPKGFLWRAWQRDLRLGVIASSDHGSTHYSYAGVYTAENSRQGVIDALRTRHTYGATDNLVLQFRTADHFMGDEWRQAEPPTFRILVEGTGRLSRVEIIRDYEFVYTAQPDGDRFEADWQDNRFTPGTHLYYLRVQQEDTSLAWTSPVWIECPGAAP